MFGPALNFGGEGIAFDAARVQDHRDTRRHCLFDAGVGRGGGHRLHDDGIHALGDQVLDVGDLLFLVKARIKDDQLLDTGSLAAAASVSWRHLYRPGVGVHAEVAHADHPGTVLLEGALWDDVVSLVLGVTPSIRKTSSARAAPARRQTGPSLSCARQKSCTHLVPPLMAPRLVRACWLSASRPGRAVQRQSCTDKPNRLGPAKAPVQTGFSLAADRALLLLQGPHAG